MTWEKKRVLITAKAAPETSTKHGEVVCTAGITDEGEFVRLYPIPLARWKRGIGFRKYDWIEVECEKATVEFRDRKESYRLKDGSIRVIDSVPIEKVKGESDWKRRNEIILKNVSPSIEALIEASNEDGTSLGLIKVRELLDFYKEKELTADEKENNKVFQMFFDTECEEVKLKKDWVLFQIPHILKYKFRCEGSSCKIHDMTCEDWELFEAYRQWRATCRTEELTWEKLRQRFFDFMKSRDLYFFVGSHSRWPIWMIIGIYYPPRKSRSPSEDIRLDDFV